MEADLQRNALTLVLRVEGVAECVIGALGKHLRLRRYLDRAGMAGEEIVVHGDDRPALRPFRHQRQREACQPAPSLRFGRPLRDSARVIEESGLGQRLVERLAGREVGRAEADDCVRREVAPVLRLRRDAVQFIGVGKDAPGGRQFREPVRLRPVLAVEMSAGVAGDVVAFGCRKADLPEPGGHLGLRLSKADVRATRRLVRRPVGFPVFRRQQEDAGQEIGEMRARAAREVAAALPLRNVARAVEGDDDHLLRTCRCV